jgi:hypothetical protein
MALIVQDSLSLETFVCLAAEQNGSGDKRATESLWLLFKTTPAAVAAKANLILKFTDNLDNKNI